VSLLALAASCLLMTTGSGAATAAEPPAAAPPMELVIVYRDWIGHMIEERYEEAAELVLPEDLESLRATTLRELRAADEGLRQRRFTSLGVGSLEELESLSARELFVEGLRSGGNVLPRLLRASKLTILEGRIEGETGWLRVHMSSSARGGELTASNDIRQGFARRGERWLVSLRPLEPPRTVVPKPAPKPDPKTQK
jgi:hypothetical protein